MKTLYNFFFKETGLDCSIFPKSMSSENGNFPDGCTGAVWSDGTPSKKYCSNDNRFPWWKKCCYWNGSKCLPKELPGDNNIDFRAFFYKFTFKNYFYE